MNTFRVKNFEKFQHYKDRSPPWIKLYNELLEDYAFSKISDSSKWHLVAIWLLASRSGNKLPYDAKWIQGRINASEKVNLEALVEAGFILLDQPLQTSEQGAITVLAECLSRERGETEEKYSPKALLNADFDEWWTVYPRKEAKEDARAAYLKARRGIDASTLWQAAKAYAAKPGREPKFTKLPATWLNKGCWADEKEIAPSKPVVTPFAIGG